MSQSSPKACFLCQLLTSTVFLQESVGSECLCVFAGNSDVLQITTSSVKTCSSGAFAMATMSVASLAVVAVAAAFAL